MKPMNSDNLKQRHDRNEAEIARGEREYARSAEAAEGDYVEYPEAQ